MILPVTATAYRVSQELFKKAGSDLGTQLCAELSSTSQPTFACTVSQELLENPVGGGRYRQLGRRAHIGPTAPLIVPAYRVSHELHESAVRSQIRPGGVKLHQGEKCSEKRRECVFRTALAKLRMRT